MNLTTEKELKFEQTLSEHSLQDGYKKTEAGIIPVDWQVKSLTEISHIERGKFSARPRNDPKYFGGIIPFIQTGDISRSNGRNVTFSQTLNEKGLAVSRLFPKNSLYFTIAANIGDVALVDFESACPDSLVVFKEKQNIDKTWLYHALSDKKSEFEVIATSNAQLNINLEKLNPYLLIVPPKEEQTAIANALSDVDALIQELEKLIAKKQAIKTATMQQLLTGRIRLPQFAHHPDGRKKGYKPSELGEIPEDWIKNKLGNIAPLQRGFDLPSTARCDGQYPVVYSNGIVNTHNKYQVKGPGVVTGRSGTLGKVHYIEQDYWPHNTSLWVTKFNQCDPKFIFFLFSFIGFERFASGSGVPTLNRNDAHCFELTLPSTVDEQIAISTILTDMDKEIQSLDQRLSKTRQIKQGMMQELLTGKTRLIQRSETI